MKKKKLFITLILCICFIGFGINSTKADSGWDTSYGGGHSSSHNSSHSSHRSSSKSSSSSGSKQMTPEKSLSRLG